MPKAGNRGAGAARTRTIAELLGKQPKSIRSHPDYAAMIGFFYASDRLKRLRLPRRCWSLMNRATVASENLPHFYRTYRLPADPFFPLFFAVKRDYLANRARLAEERRRYIVSRLKALPPEVLERIKYLGFLERHYNAAGASPVWQKHLFPGSKKQADAYTRFDRAAWLERYRRHLSLLVGRYPRITGAAAERVFACFVLELTPSGIPPQPPPREAVMRGYRALSMRHHPDRGGDPALFLEITRARETLLGRYEPPVPRAR